MKTTKIAGLCVLLALGTVFAADGAIPIWEPTTITEPGSYVLTRDIGGSVRCDRKLLGRPCVAAFGTIFIATDDVDLDLNGFSVEGSNAIVAEGNGLTIHGGFVTSPDEPCVWVRGDNFVLRDLSLAVGDDEVVYLDGNNGIVERLVVGPAAYGGPGIVVTGTGVTIRDNVIHDTGYGIWIRGGEGNHFTRNTITGCQVGIQVEGSLNLIEGHLITGSGTGISMGGNDNVYRGNVARGNGTDFVVGGTNNTSHGDNYMPGQM